MSTNANGQATYLVLDSLAHGSKYGLEIIEYILNKTNGNFVLKKPTLYSCLTRMEKKGLVSSSYWGESELGGKRHYYTITNSGKVYLSELASEFANVNFSQVSSESESATEKKELVTEKDEIEEKTKPVFYQQDNLFSMTKEPQIKKEQEEQNSSNILENQIDIFSMSQQKEETVTAENTEKTEQFEKTEEVSTIETTEKIEKNEKLEQPVQQTDDAKFLEPTEHLTAYQEEQNRRLYDTSSDLKKYRNKKSFSENQIEMSVVYNNAQDEEIQRQRIEALKQSMLKAKENNFNQIQIEKNSFEEPKTSEKKEEKTVEVKDKDDAVFITEPRIETSDIPIQKKITPPNLEISVTNDNLPAPKRNTNLEPTYKDMMSKLFERKKEKKSVQPPVQEVKQEEFVGSFVDYDTLKRYYNTHGIEFKEYNKTKVERIHNTNFLNFISSVFLLLCSGIGCSIFYGIIAGAKLLQNSTNFLFYTIPLLFLIYAIFNFICDKAMPSKKASFKLNSITNWAIFALSSIIVLIINVISGMQYETTSLFLTSLLLPIFALLLIFPINHYVKKFLYKKYAK